MDYQVLNEMPYYKEIENLVSSLGYSLVSVKVTPMKMRTQVQVVIAFKDFSRQQGIGIDDCAKVHRLLAPRLEALLQNQDVYMEVTSPGLERNIKNAAEFALFLEKCVKVFNKEEADWVKGKIVNADENQLSLEILSETNGTSKIVVIPYSNIAKAKLFLL